MYQGRDGIFKIEKLSYEDTGYVIKRKVSYSYPEINYSRPLKEVAVTYLGNAAVVYSFGAFGETQTVSNEFIATNEQAKTIAKWACDNLRSRQKIDGECRGDPRIDLFDVVRVENKYGTVEGVVLTDIKYTFTGAFRATYSGYVRGSGVSAVVYCGDKFAGEGV